MSAVYVVAGLLALAAMLATFVLGMRGVERAVTRALGLPRFRWFEVSSESDPAWKVLLVRLTSTLVPFGICVAVFFVFIAIQGVPEDATTVVDVLPNSAAHDAGLKDGDRVLAVADVSVSTWEELKAQVARHPDPMPIAFERAGQRESLMVTPRNGRIGVTPQQSMRSASLAEAAWSAVALPLRIVEDSAKALVGPEGKELKGPVGIVGETSKAARSGSLEVLYFLAVLGSYLWPFIAATHAVDIVTGWIFRLVGDDALPKPTAQIARLRLAMYFVLGCWLVLLLAQVALHFEVPGGATLAILVTPGIWAVWPLLWVSARALRELGQQSSPAGTVLPVVVIPCAAPIMAIWITRLLGVEEQRLRSQLKADQALTGTSVV